jgi:hypothetical protein
MWVFVYKIMAYLPACIVLEERGAKTARWLTWLMAVFLPLVFIIPQIFRLVWRVAVAAWILATRKKSDRGE